LPAPSRADCWPLSICTSSSIPDQGSRAMRPGCPFGSPGVGCVGHHLASRRVMNRLSTECWADLPRGTAYGAPGGNPPGASESILSSRGVHRVRERALNPRRRSPAIPETPRVRTDYTSVDKADDVSHPWGVVPLKVMVTLDPSRRLASKASIP
jgi:hypothetical protein